MTSKDLNSKKVIIKESYNGWYAYFEGDDPDYNCILDGQSSSRRCYSAVRAELGNTIEIEIA